MTVTAPSLEPTRGKGASSTSFNDVRRELATRLNGAAPPTSSIALELVSRVQDTPSVRSVEPIEDGGMRAHAVGDATRVTTPGFDAFLDGAQWSLVLWADGIPVVHGTVAAVIRERHNRRMTTWRAPIVRRALYAPIPLLSHSWQDALGTLDIEVIDTLAKRKPESGHPFELQEIAYQTVLSARESVERVLGEQWCTATAAHLFIDGGIAASKTLASATNVVGVVKSHQRLYSTGGGLTTVMRLRAGERSSAFKLAESKRPAVGSWYLRLRDVDGHDPLWGLVRVEVALPADVPTKTFAHRVNEVSRWILGEGLPLSVPDARWDKMVYGIRDCEEFLRAIQ